MSDDSRPDRASRWTAIVEPPNGIAMTRLKEGSATIVLDATGLSAEQRAALERQIRAATIAMPGVTDTQIAMTAEKMRADDHRDRQRQGRGRQVDRLGQSRGRAWRGWARRSAWSTPTFTGPRSPGSWASTAAPS